MRGYLAGSGWKEYQQSGTVCGIQLPRRAAGVEPAAGAHLHAVHQGGDRRPRREHLVREDGGAARRATWPRRCATRRSRCTRSRAAYARERGIIIADTKFEFGLLDDELILIDEALTPDSSRFWPADGYEPGKAPAELRQAVRARLSRDAGLGQDGARPRAARARSAARTADKYREAWRRLTQGVSGAADAGGADET